MAITKNVFTAQDSAASIQEVGEWLTDNASVVGMTVTTGEDGGVTCTTKDGTNFLNIRYNSASNVLISSITLANGSTYESTSRQYVKTWSSGYDCSDGLVMFGSNGTEVFVMFIGKTTKGGICVLLSGTTESIYADIDHGTKPTKTNSASSTNAYFLSKGTSSVRTSFAPLCFDSGDISNEVFFTPQTQFARVTQPIEMIISDGDNEYVYDGLFAMKG